VTISTVSAGLRERKRRATRRALQEAALRLTAERGLEAVTVEDISSAVDVSSRTFFNYFPTKEDALAGEQSWLPEPAEVQRILVDERGPSLIGDLHRVLLAAVPRFHGRREEIRTRSELIKRYPVLLRTVLASFLADEQTLQNLVARRLGSAEASSGLPRLAAVETTALLRAALDRWMEDDPGDDLQLSARIDDVLHELRALFAEDRSAVPPTLPT
jgi:AcrR family transcriptional regulator